MANKTLTMRLLVEGEEKQRLEANLSVMSGIFNAEITGLPKISGENHINPQAIFNVETAYRTFESIRYTEYNDKEVRIELTYN
jgi:hypothetical protein